jgi:hypothetical protein
MGASGNVRLNNLDVNSASVNNFSNLIYARAASSMACIDVALSEGDGHFTFTFQHLRRTVMKGFRIIANEGLKFLASVG